MHLQSAANMHANRRRLLITDKTRQSFHSAMMRMQMANALEKARAECERHGHSFMGGSRCIKCAEPNPAILVLPDHSEAA